MKFEENDKIDYDIISGTKTALDQEKERIDKLEKTIQELVNLHSTLSSLYYTKKQL